LLLLTAYGSGLGSGYADGYGGGAMKGSAYAAKAPGPYGGMILDDYMALTLMIETWVWKNPAILPNPKPGFKSS